MLGIPPKKSASISWNVICLFFFSGLILEEADVNIALE